jgi:hypothetical protein
LSTQKDLGASLVRNIPLSGLILAIPLKAIGDYALTNALVTGWISIGSLFMLTGLLIMSRSAEGKESRYE